MVIVGMFFNPMNILAYRFLSIWTRDVFAKWDSGHKKNKLRKKTERRGLHRLSYIRRDTATATATTTTTTCQQASQHHAHFYLLKKPFARGRWWIASFAIMPILTAWQKVLDSHSHRLLIRVDCTGERHGPAMASYYISHADVEITTDRRWQCGPHHFRSSGALIRSMWTGIWQNTTPWQTWKNS